MSWNMDTKLAARGYTDRDERAAFRAGYTDGYHGRESRIETAYKSFQNAYAAGFNEGLGDGYVSSGRART